MIVDCAFLDVDRSINKQSWKKMDRFRRIHRRILNEQLKDFDFAGFNRDMLLYGTAKCQIGKNGKVSLIKAEPPAAL